MKITKVFCVAAALIFFASASDPVSAKILTRCEYAEHPLGLDVSSPRLMWKMESAKSGYLQKSYRILVASSPELLAQGKGNIWDSGKISSDDQTVYYAGPALDPHTRYWWVVELWGNKGKENSRPDWFETAKMSPDQWQAQWITDSHNIDYEPSPMFRRDFTVNEKITSARCYITGLGYYELYINSNKLNEARLDPGFTDYSKRVLYNTYDITESLQRGENTIGVQLGNGWFNEQTPTVWNFHRAPWRARPRMICEVHITYENGSSEVIASDLSWKTSAGPVRFDNIHVGTTYDSGYEQAGWNAPGFDDSRWSPVILTSSPAPLIEAQKMQPVGASAIIETVSVTKKHETSYVFDMGVNFAGVSRLKIKGPQGASVTLRHGEMLDSPGNIDQQNINMHLRPRNGREVMQTDIYVLKGTGDYEYFTPPFTYHGFRYVQMTLSEPMEVDLGTLSGVVMHSLVEPAAGFECSQPLLNKINEICRRSYLSNLFGIPTDCPTREKNGWMADGFMVQEAGMLNYDSRNVYAKWVRDMIDAQSENGDVPGIVPTSWQWDSEWAGPIWDAAIFIVPMLLYQHSGDVETVREIYPAAERYLKFATTLNEKGLVDHGLGDWLFYKAQTPVDFMCTCYYYHDNVLMARMAQLLGRTDEAEQYSAKAEKIKTLINETFFDPGSVSYSNRTQLSYALPIYMDIVPDQYRAELARNLEKKMAETDYSLDFGFIGSLVVPEVLSGTGNADAVYKMLTKTTLPSWGYWIEKTGATSLYETWDVTRSVGDASLNHPSMGAISAWMYKTLAGINMDMAAPAFKKIVIKPAFVDGLDWVNAFVDSQQGRISSSWNREGDKVTLEVSIPAGATATVVLPDKTYRNVGSGERRFVTSVK